MNIKRMGKKQKEIFDMVASGRLIHFYYEGEFKKHFIEGYGDVAPEMMRNLIARGLLAESQDAMFGTGQTYSLVQPQGN